MRRLQWAMAALALPVLLARADAGQPRNNRPSVSTSVVSNQELASQLAQLYKASGRLHDYAVDIEVDGGVVTLVGKVADKFQWAELMTMTSRYPGIERVVDEVQVHNGAGLINAGYSAAMPRAFPQPTMAAPVASAMIPAQATGPVSGGGQVVEPAPANSFAGGIAPYADAPVMPPYSWPSYTPYNNYASMAYQTQYPAGAWPFIGPPHPYPMIPSGWRRVTLKWKKGYWWMKFHAH